MRIGIPASLLYYERFPLWRAFLVALGHEIVLSRPESKSAIERGISMCVDESCLPLKLCVGHVTELVGRCDAIFMPRMATVEPDGHLCPKIIGLPDIVRAVVPECPAILDPLIDVERGVDPARTFAEAATRLGSSGRDARRAYRLAARTQAEFDRIILSGVPRSKALDAFVNGRDYPEADTPGSGPRVALLGHSYNLHDECLNMGIPGRLRSLGCEPVFSDALPDSVWSRPLESFSGKVYWYYAKRILGAALHLFESNEVDGVIYIVSFGCGPDGLVKALVDLESRRHGGMPYMSVVLDEHSGEAGVLTRLEAFVDTIELRKSRPRQPSAAAPPTGALSRQSADYLASFPHMGNLSIPVHAVLEDLKIRHVVPPPMTRRTLELGAAHSPDMACLPFKLTLGSYMEALDIGATHLMAISSRFGASCRLYFFPTVQERILAELGRSFEIVPLDGGRRDSGNEIGRLAFERLGISKWRLAKSVANVFVRKLLACERVEQLAAGARPYEKARGLVWEIENRALARIDRAEPKDLRRIVRETAEEMFAAKARRDRPPLVVGLIGELYVLSDPFANHHALRRLGELGCAVETNFSVGRKILRTLWRPLDPHYARAMKAAERYLGYAIDAECNSSVGDVVEMARRGFDGIVHVMPFTCMPEIVAEYIIPKASSDARIPVMSLALDEQTSDVGIQTRLEAFVDMLASSGRRNSARVPRA